MKHSSIEDFLRNLGEKSPTPGGGAVSALNGAIATAQLKMVCEYTKDGAIASKTENLSQIMDSFLNLAEEDSAAFQAVSEAYKNNDPNQINSSLQEALKPSKAIVDACRELIDFCEKNYKNFNHRLKPDLVVALANIKAAIRSSQAMLKTNLEALDGDSPDETRDYINNCYDLLNRVDKLYEKLGA